MIAATSVSSRARVKASRSSARVGGRKALWTSGRLIVIFAIDVAPLVEHILVVALGAPLDRRVELLLGGCVLVASRHGGNHSQSFEFVGFRT